MITMVEIPPVWRNRTDRRCCYRIHRWCPRPSIAHYVHILKDKAALRETAKFAESISHYVSQPSASPDTIRQRIAAFNDKLACAVPEKSSRIQSWEQIPTLASLPVGEVDWVVEGMIPSSGVVLWAGESGSFKTWLALLLAKAVQEGTEFLGRKTVRRPVLYLDRENPLQLVHERCSMLGMHPSEALRIWGGWQLDQPPMIGDPRLLELARTIKPLIVVDSFIRFHAADENSATEMGRIMAEVRALANAGLYPYCNTTSPRPKALSTGEQRHKSGGRCRVCYHL